MLGRDARLCPLTPADCCLSKCQYSLQKTDLRQSELGLLRGEEHSGLHRPGGDGADVGSQVRDRARPLIWRCRVISSELRPAAGLSPELTEKHREKWRDKVSPSNNSEGGGRRIL